MPNIDKHRRLHVVTCWPDLVYRGSDGPSKCRWKWGTPPFANGAILGYLFDDPQRSAPLPELQHQVDLRLTGSTRCQRRDALLESVYRHVAHRVLPYVLNLGTVCALLPPQSRPWLAGFRCHAGHVQAEPSDGMQHAAGREHVSTGADDQGAIHQPVGPGEARVGRRAQHCAVAARVAKVEDQRVPGEPVAPGQGEPVRGNCPGEPKPDRGAVPRIRASRLPPGSLPRWLCSAAAQSIPGRAASRSSWHIRRRREGRCLPRSHLHAPARSECHDR